MKKLIIILILCISSQTINAKPMWEVSSNWVCSLEYSTNMIVEKNSIYGEQLERFRKLFPDEADKINSPFNTINKHEPWTYFLDFKKSTLTNISAQTYPIYDRHYYDVGDSDGFNNYNIIVIKSKDEEQYTWYSIYIVEEFIIYGTSEVEFWMRQSSGPIDVGDDGILKTKAYKCNPVK